MAEGSISENGCERRFVLEALPSNALERLCSYLSADDVQNALSVFKESINNATLWKDKPLILKPNDTVAMVKAKLLKYPFLHTIQSEHICVDTNQLVEAILSNLVDLRQININFDPPLSTSQLRKISRQFKNMELISLNISNPYIVQSLEALRDFTKLKEIRFLINSIDPDYLDNTGMALRIIADNFPNLRYLNIGLFQTTDLDQDVFRLLETKLGQLIFLKLSVHSQVSPIILAVVFENMSLQELNVKLWNSPSIPLNLQSMWSLKCLTINCGSGVNKETFSGIRFPENLTKLMIYFQFNTAPFHTGIVKNIIRQCSMLKHLEMYYIPDMDLENQLKDIGNLKSLRAFYVFPSKHLSRNIVHYVTKCPLTILCINSVTLSDSEFQSIESCVNLRRLVFWECKMNIDFIFPLVFKLKHLSELYITHCVDYETGPIDDSTLQNLTEKCKLRVDPIFISSEIPPSILAISDPYYRIDTANMDIPMYYI